MFDESMLAFWADNISLTLNEEGDAYTLKSAVNEDCLVNITFTRNTPGFVIGKDGTSYFGTDPANPWGSMRHAFWPRCSVEGTITTKEQNYDMKGRGMFIQGLQGMKPHHAGKRPCSYKSYLMILTMAQLHDGTLLTSSLPRTPLS